MLANTSGYFFNVAIEGLALGSWTLLSSNAAGAVDLEITAPTYTLKQYASPNGLNLD